MGNIPGGQKLAYLFENFELDEESFRLVQAGRRVPLEPKSLRVLLLLVRAKGKVVPKNMLLEEVWKGTFVDESTLTRAIALLRKQLGDDRRQPRFIETVPTIGYRFIASIVERAATGTEAGTSIAGERLNGASLPDFPRKAKPMSRVHIAIGMSALIVLLAAGAFTGLHRHRSQLPAMRSLPLTMVSGLADDPAFSPDGDKVAFFWDAEGNAHTDLYVQLVGGERPLRVTTHRANGFLCCASWSPDARQIAFFRCDDDGGAIYAVPALGGSERRLTDATCLYGQDGYPEWTPDAKSLLISDHCVPNRPRGIVLFSLGTGEKRCLTTPPPLGDGGDYAPKLSPDGRILAFLRSTTVDLSEIYTVELSGANLRQLTADGGTIDRFMWSPDGHDIIFNSSRKGVGRPWRVSAAGGPIAEEERYPGVGSLSRDGRRLAYVGYSGLPGTIWRTRVDEPNESGKMPSFEGIVASACGNDSPQISPDQRQLVFRSCRSGNPELWISSSNGDDPYQLTFRTSGWLGSPRWSPDGKWIAFDYRIRGHSQIQMIEANTRNDHPVTAGEFDNEVPTWSRDGSSLYFSSNRTGSWQLWKRQITSGRETQITRNGGIALCEAPDGNILYYSKLDAPGIWSLPKNGGDEKLVTGRLHRGYWGDFSVTERGIYLLDVDAVPRPTIMLYHFRTKRLSPVIQLSQQADPWSPDFTASSDGRVLFLSQSVPQNSITMVENLR